MGDKMKTLKDIEHKTYFDGEIDWVSSDDLRQAAREWIKHFDNEINRFNSLINTWTIEDKEEYGLTGFRRPASAIPSFDNEINACRVEISWIKHFFNLDG